MIAIRTIQVTKITNNVSLSLKVSDFSRQIGDTCQKRAECVQRILATLRINLSQKDIYVIDLDNNYNAGPWNKIASVAQIELIVEQIKIAVEMPNGLNPLELMVGATLASCKTAVYSYKISTFNQDFRYTLQASGIWKFCIVLYSS